MENSGERCGACGLVKFSFKSSASTDSHIIFLVCVVPHVYIIYSNTFLSQFQLVGRATGRDSVPVDLPQGEHSLNDYTPRLVGVSIIADDLESNHEGGYE